MNWGPIIIASQRMNFNGFIKLQEPCPTLFPGSFCRLFTTSGGLKNESSPQEDAVQVEIPPDEVSRRGVGDHRSTLNPPACSRAVDALHLAVGQPADIAREAMIMAKESSSALGNV